MTNHTCPICKSALPSQGKYKPFCSARCKMIDLHHWLSGTYAVPDEPIAQAAANRGEDMDAEDIEAV